MLLPGSTSKSRRDSEATAYCLPPVTTVFSPLSLIFIDFFPTVIAVIDALHSGETTSARCNRAPVELPQKHPFYIFL